MDHRINYDVGKPMTNRRCYRNISTPPHTDHPGAVVPVQQRIQEKPKKQVQWEAFINKNKLTYPFPFTVLIEKLRQFIEPIYHWCQEAVENNFTWSPDKWEWRQSRQ